jgi:hypothetical protein
MLYMSCLFPGIQPGDMHRQSESDGAEICRFRVEVGEEDRTDAVASVLLGDITHVHDSLLALYEIQGVERIRTPFQIENAGHRRFMHWMLKGKAVHGTYRHYALVRESSRSDIQKKSVHIACRDGDYLFTLDGRNVLLYRAKVVEPPEGVDSSFRRSGFINPLYAPNQTVLTRVPDGADDHLHHYGLWNAWKKVVFRGEEIDFFAPQFGQGTVRHIGIAALEEGHVLGRLQVLRDHVTWQGTDREAVAMHDLMEVRVYDSGAERYVVDITYQYDPVEPFLIKAYRYAGFSFRATDLWTKDNSSILTSEGHARDEADGRGSRWCMVWGDTPQGPVTMVFMSHPANYNHPEPMRIWPSGMNDGVGHVYVNYNPARNTDWLLSPGRTYRLHYRLFIVDGTLNKQEAEQAWHDFANPLKVMTVHSD